LRRNCLLKHVIEEAIGGIEVTGGLGRRRKLLLDYLKEIGYWKLKEEEEALDRTVWRTLFARGYVLQTTE
jgi:hypothetical protein